MIEKNAELDTKNADSIDPQRIKYLWSKLRQAVRSYIVFKRMGSDIKMFGANETVDITTELEPRYIIHPNSKEKKIWNTVLVGFIVLNAVFLPYHACFNLDSGYWKFIKLFEDLVFAFDFILSFFCSYWHHEHTLVTRKKLIAIKYLKTWLFFDLIAFLPFQFLDDYVLLSLLSLVKFFKLLSSSMHLPDFFSLSSNHSVERLFKILSALVVSVQVLGCIWYMLAKANNFPEDSWIVAQNIQDKSNYYIYLSCIYWVFVTITTIGYGDITPKNNTEKVYAMSVMALGVAFYSLTIGNLTTLIATMDQKTRIMNTKLETLQDLAKEIKMPVSLKERIRKTVIHNCNENLSLYNETHIISELPSGIRSEVSLYLHKTIIEKIKFFHNKDPSFLALTVPKLKHMSCAEHEYLYHIDDDAYESIFYIVFFIKSGRIMLKASNGVTFRAYPIGSYFGEIELLNSTPRNSSAQVSTKPAELLTLSKKNLEIIFKEFPEIGFELNDVAQIRKQVNEESMSHVLKLQLTSNEPEDSLKSESLSEPEEEEDVSARNKTWLSRRDTGVMVSNMAISQHKVKNISRWSKAVQESGRSKTLCSKQNALLLLERKKNMKRQASVRTRKEPKYKLAKSPKAMDNGEKPRLKIPIDEIDIQEDVYTRILPIPLNDMQVSGLLDEVASIDNLMLDHSSKSLDTMHKISTIQQEIIDDMEYLENFISSL